LEQERGLESVFMFGTRKGFGECVCAWNFSLEQQKDLEKNCSLL
jgi:hypothetical protein